MYVVLVCFHSKDAVIVTGRECRMMRRARSGIRLEKDVTIFEMKIDCKRKFASKSTNPLWYHVAVPLGSRTCVLLVGLSVRLEI